MNKTIIIESMHLYNYENPEKGVTVGGSQRYSLDIGRLFYKLGYQVIYLTKANKNMESNYDDWAKIIAFDSPYGEKGRLDFSKKVYSFCKKIKPDIVCYSDLEIGYPYCYENSFAIQHGIDWDNPSNKLKNSVKAFFYLKAMHNFKKVICVDTNFINWCREKDKLYFNNPEKLVYIPNYADETQFNYKYKEWKKGEVYKLLYPRRLVTHRGFDIFMKMCEILISKGYNIKPILAFEEFKNKDFRSEFPQYEKLDVEIVHPSMNQIHSLYHDAYLAFVPTRWSEGTSLSAIEAISTGCPIIVSDVGGLGNIVLPGFNGYIVSPSVNTFVAKTEELLNNVAKRNELSRNCESMNEIFGKKRWEEQIIHATRLLLN